MADTSSSDTPQIPKLIVGLGNPGTKYDQTRHNIGFMAVDALARSWQISLADHRKFQGIFGEGWYRPGQKIRLLKPSTYMNRSGEAVRSTLDWFKLLPEEVLIIYDDMDLPFGKLRLRLTGSAGGHNGMKSAIAHLGTQNFPRLRLGIGSPKSLANQATSQETSQEDRQAGDAIPHVLGKFARPETDRLPQLLNLLQDTVELSLREGLAKAMSLYNNRMVDFQ